MTIRFSKKIFVIDVKGQLISKCLLGNFNSPKKRMKKFDFTTMAGTSSQIIVVCFLGELKTQKRYLEIN